MRQWSKSQTNKPPNEQTGKPMRQYDHLFFDLDNTLWDFDKNSKDSLLLISNNLTINCSFDDFFQYFDTVNNQLWKEYQNKKLKQKEVVVKRFELVFDKFKIKADPEKANDQFLQLLPGRSILKPYTIETLQYLKDKGYRLHIVTNGIKDIQIKKIENSGISRFFELIITSEEVGIPKPDKRIFRYALTKANARKIKSIVIGDSWESDIIGAQQVGMKSIFISWDKPVAENHPSTIIISNLRQIQELL